MAYTLTSKFNPLTYDQIVKPLMQQTEAHNQLEDAYSELLTKANVWEGMANKETDAKAYAQYKKYADDLKAKADELAANGLSSSSRQALMSMKSRYSSEITPIENAYTQRKEQMKEQQQAMLKDPTLLLSRKAANTSLDAYLDNPMLGYENYSGNLLTEQVSKAASNLANELSSYGKEAHIDPYTFAFLKKYGYSKSQVLDAINNPKAEKSQPVLDNIVKSVMRSSGIEGWGDAETTQKAFDYAKRGLYSAIGKSDVAPMEDYEKRLALQSYYRAQLETAKEKGKQDKEGASPQLDLVNHHANTGELKSEYEKKINKYKDFFTKNADGTYSMNQRGKDAVQKVKENANSTELNYYNGKFGVFFYPKAALNPFRDLVQGSATPEQYAKAYALLVNEMNKASDSTISTGVRFNIESADDKEWKRKLNAVTSTLYEVEYDPKTLTYKRGNSFDMSKLDKASILNAVVDSGGSYLTIQTDDNEVKKIELPKGMNRAAEAQIESAVSNLRNAEAAYNAGPKTPERKAKMDAIRKELMSNINASLARFVITNHSKSNSYGNSSTDFSYE